MIQCTQRLLFLFPLFLLSVATIAQREVVQTEVTYARKLGTTPPLRNLPQAPATHAEKLRKYKENKPEFVPNFLGRKGTPDVKPGALPFGEDPVRQGLETRSNTIEIEPTANFEGLDLNISGSGVPDVNGDASLEHYIQVVNSTIFRVFDKDGNNLGLINANTIWNEVGFTSAGDPIILYDQGANRWFLTEFPPANRILVAISETSDPFGSWTAYTFQTPNFPDYPKYSIWPQAYMLTTNEFGFQLACYALDREALLNGEEEVAIVRFGLPRSGFPFEVPTPVNWDGATAPPEGSPAMIMRIHDDALGNGEDRIDLWEIDINFTNAGSVTLNNLEIPTAPFDAFFCSVPGSGFSCVPQPNGQGIDGIPWVIMHRANYRNFPAHESLVLNFTVDATGDNVAGIRWMELRRDAISDWSIYQEGTFAPDTLQRFMGGIAIDGSGNIGLGYSVSSADKSPSLRFTGRRSSDPPGTMTVEEYEFASGEGSLGFDRFGDYASMSVDPSDGRTFWYTGEYVKSGGRWSTGIVSFSLGRDSIDVRALNVITPRTDTALSTEEVISISFVNEGILPVTEFEVGYILEGQVPVVEQALIDTLLTDSIYVHTFSTPADLSAIRSYPLKIFTTLANDQNRLNDTLIAVVSNLARRDLASVGFTGIEVPVCDTQVLVQFVFSNLGVDTIRTAKANWLLDGMTMAPIGWEGTLGPGQQDTIGLQLSDLVDGEYQISAYLTSPNGLEDQIPLNDTISQNFSVITDGTQIFLNLKTDRSPVETTWQLTDEDGNIIYSGGPYGTPETTIEEEWCLDPDSCYIFTIFDAFGDGLSSSGAFGNYSISDAEGRELASMGQPNFGSEASHPFCGQFICNLTAGVNVSHESVPGANDGSFVVSQITGTSPFQFSIDSGATFSPFPLFNNLPPGDYNLLVLDANACTSEVPFTILPCHIEIFASTSPESSEGANDAEIGISLTGGAPPFLYSIDGGANLVVDSIFTELESGQYDILVRDQNGCEVTAVVEIGLMTHTTNPGRGRLVKVYPNPTDGVLWIEAYGSARQEVQIQIFNASGEIIQYGSLAKYNDVLKGYLSLRAFPSGIYYLRLDDAQFQNLYRIIKQ